VATGGTNERTGQAPLWGHRAEVEMWGEIAFSDFRFRFTFPIGSPVDVT